MNTYYSRTTNKSRNTLYNLEKELEIRNYSPKTIKSYLYYNKEFLNFFFVLGFG